MNESFWLFLLVLYQNHLIVVTLELLKVLPIFIYIMQQQNYQDCLASKKIYFTMTGNRA